MATRATSNARWRGLGAALAALVCAGACVVEDEGSIYDELLVTPESFPDPQIPEDNPLTAAKVELGRHLFYDEQLSANQTQACAGCHFQELAFSDGLALPTGSTGEVLERNSMGLGNTAYATKLTWANPTLDTIEQQIRVPLFGEFPVELGVTGHEDEVLARFAEDPFYLELFEAAFPEAEVPVTWDNLIRGLASFVRAMSTASSPYDRFTAGEEDAISESAKRGADLFFSEVFECHHCHGGFNFSLAVKHQNTTFTQQSFQNNGLYNIDGEGGYPEGNRGIYEFTFEDSDMGRFRPPSLRNVALTAPYMHDGSVATLEDVIEIYAAGGRVIPEGEANAGDGRENPNKSGFVSGFQATDEQKADLIAFLESLTDEDFVTDPRLSDPFQ
ncbi:di-heme enzyme [Pseudenhygromyxa sp. WMMC2535]|nr:di-heme enzyme [Pseudenhygromyxa sp. WMMC2535]